MKNDPQKHHRRSIRLKGFDYSSAGAYFVTICTQNRECVLHDPVIMGIINNVWQGLSGRYPTVDLDEFVIMPNHIHFIIWLGVGARLAGARDMDDVGAPLAGAQNTGARDIDVVGVPLASTQNAGAQDVDVVGVPLAGAQNAGAQESGAAPTLGVGADQAGAVSIPRAGASPAPTLGNVVGAFKSLVFRDYLDWVEIHDPSRTANSGRGIITITSFATTANWMRSANTSSIIPSVGKWIGIISATSVRCRLQKRRKNI